jgi:23S rRNA (guanine745-N1)-methyltransferase
MATLLCTVRDCRSPLAREARRVVCDRGHSFDVARSGYINLLQPQDRRARVPGDSPDAVAARRRFLDRGFAEPLLKAMRDVIPHGTLLDAGCGEGYYLGSLTHGERCGIDISTAAIELAAKRYPDCEWVIANADRLIPYADASFDGVMSITGRLNADEFRRVIKPDGRLIIAVAAPDDLVEIRGRANRDRVQRTVEMFAPQFRLADQQRATAQVELDEEAVRDVRLATYRGRTPVPRGGTGAPLVTLSLDVLVFTVA